MLRELSRKGADGVVVSLSLFQVTVSHLSKLLLQDIDGLIGCLNTGLNWALSELLPIFDLFRIALLNESVNGYYCTGVSRDLTR